MTETNGTPDKSWLVTDPAVPVVAPLISTASNRSHELLESVIEQFDVESTERYRVRDVTGDGKKETWCNLYVSDVTTALCAPLPHRYGGKWQNVRDMANQLRSLRGSWRPCTSKEAQDNADTGSPSVVVYDPKDEATHGHIAMLVPSHNAIGIWISQAGARNFRRAPLLAGFGSFADSCEFFFHP